MQIAQGPLGLLAIGGLTGDLRMHGHHVDARGPAPHPLFDLLDALGEALLDLREIGADTPGVDVEHLPEGGRDPHCLGSHSRGTSIERFQ